MATVVISFKVMPESPDTDLEGMKSEIYKEVRKFAALESDEEVRIEDEPVAFGLVALKVMFAMDEKRGGTEPLEKAIEKIKGVNSVEVTDVRRAVG